MNPAKNRSRGKRAERAIAKLLDGKRVGIMGNEDVDTKEFSVEVKSRKRVSVEKFMEQAEANCQPNKTPLVVIHTHGKRHANDLVMLRMKDFELLYGSLN